MTPINRIWHDPFLDAPLDGGPRYFCNMADSLERWEFSMIESRRGANGFPWAFPNWTK
jgi:hypothetical protein